MMEASEITRRNEAIINYMGGLEYVWKAHFPDWIIDEAYLLDEDDLAFHYSWDWIMPVVEKILAESKDAFHILHSYSGGFVSRFGIGQNRRGDTPIKATWMAVSDYILEKK